MGQPEMTNVLDGLPDGTKLPVGDVVIVGHGDNIRLSLSQEL